MASTAAQLIRRNSAPATVHGTFRVEMLDSQESLDLDCGKFYTEYILRCTWTEHSGEEEIWDIVRRYREFCAIDLLLREKYPSRASLFPLLPGKKLFGLFNPSLSADFVDRRQRDLGYYISAILHSFPLLVRDEIIDSFLEIKRHLLERAREQELQRQAPAQRLSVTIRPGSLHALSD